MRLLLICAATLLGACEFDCKEVAPGGNCEGDLDCVVARCTSEQCACEQVFSQRSLSGAVCFAVRGGAQDVCELNSSVQCGPCPTPPASAVCQEGKCVAGQ